MTRFLSYIFQFFLLLQVIACTKNGTDPAPIPPPNGSLQLSYGDSIVYLKNQSTDQLITPKSLPAGTYIGFPDGLVIDPSSGVINVSKSDAGLKYKISYVANGSKDTLSTFLTISGINYLDGFYKLGTADSVIQAVYNADPKAAIPGLNNGTAFDLGSGCNSQGCNVNTINASINLAATVRNGIFGSTPSNNDRKEFELQYQINDKSGKTTNKLKVKLYYYETMNDVTPEAYDIINSRQGTIFLSGIPTPVASAAKVGKPRPPCIFIVGR
jgi:hypothetical protein